MSQSQELPTRKDIEPVQLDEHSLSAGDMRASWAVPIPRHQIALEIHSCRCDMEVLQALSAYYTDFFINHFRKFKVLTPPSFAETQEAPLADIIGAPRDHKEAKIQANIRDNYRCVITGQIDRSQTDTPVDRDGTIYGFNRCAHIVPESSYLRVTESGPEKDYSASILAVLDCFGYNADDLNGPKVHSLAHVMTLSPAVHELFDRLQIYMEPRDTSQADRHNYTWHTMDMRQINAITLTTPDPQLLPLPNPKLLTLHATCVKVAHLSGAGEYIDKLIEDIEYIGVLSDDGTSKEVVEHMLWDRLGPLVQDERE